MIENNKYYFGLETELFERYLIAFRKMFKNRIYLTIDFF